MLTPSVSRETAVQWAGVDYFRGVYSPYEVREAGGADRLWAAALGAMGFRPVVASPVRWRVGEYDGWLLAGAGVATDREGAAIVQVAGAAAGSYLRDVIAPERISRLDVQITAKPGEGVQERIEQEWEALIRQYESWPHRGRAPRPWAIVDVATTVYSGRRSKDGVMLRIYDSGHVHGHESAAYEGTVRYELECTGSAARRVFAQSGGKEWSEDRICAVVVETAKHRGCVVSVEGVQGERVKPEPRVGGASAASTLEWLRRQVRPAIKRLEEMGVPNGIVLEALFGLTPVSDVDGNHFRATDERGILPQDGA